MAEIIVEQLRHVYSTGTPFEVAAIEDIDLTIPQGQLVGIIGHTGSGKSTLLQALDGLIKPSDGEIIIDGISLTDKETSLVDVRKRVGIVFQYPEYQLFEETVAKDVSFGPSNLGLEGDELEAAVRSSIELVGLDYERIKDKSPFELSGGQKRRVAIAGVIAMNPGILILDEPTAGLDPTAHKEILSMVKRIHETRNIIIVFVSHNMGDVADMCDKVLVMNEGRIILDGTPRYVFGQKDVLDEIGLGVTPAAEIVGRIRERIPEIDSDVLSMEEAAASLAEFIKRKRS